MLFNKLFITGLFILFACGPGNMASKVEAATQCATLADVKADGTKLFVVAFGAPPVIATMDEATAKAFDKVYSEAKGVAPEVNLDQIVHFTNNKYDLIVFMYKGCSTVASKITHKDFMNFMGRIEA